MRDSAAMIPILDPEREGFVPGRRRFLFLSGLAFAGTVIGGRLFGRESVIGKRLYAATNEPFAGRLTLVSLETGEVIRVIRREGYTLTLERAVTPGEPYVLRDFYSHADVAAVLNRPL